jgi:hypothetical protein
MTEQKQETCADKVTSNLAGRIEDLRKFWDIYNDPDATESDQEEFLNYGLSFDYVPYGTFEDQEGGYFRYQISWGGPGEEFRFYADPQFHCYRIEYWFLDWGDGAHIVLEGNIASLLGKIWDFFYEGGSVQAEFDKATQES